MPAYRPSDRAAATEPGRRHRSAACPAAARRPRPSCSRTSATPSSTTCPASCCPTSPSSSRTTASGSRGSRSCSTSAPATPRLALAAMRGALEGRGIRPRVVFLEASDDVLIRRFSETRHRHPLDDDRGIASSIAQERAAASIRSGPRRTSSSTPPTCRCASCASGCSPRLGDRRPAGPAGVPAHQLRVQVRRARSRRTSCSTSGSSRTPYYVAGPAPACPVSPTQVRDFVLAQPVARRYLEFLQELLDVHRSGVRSPRARRA